MSEGFDIISPCSDYGFHRVTQNSDVVCGFLNSVLKLEPPVQTARIISTNLFKGTNFTVNLLCKTTDAEFVIVKMQNSHRDLHTEKDFVQFCQLVPVFDESVYEIGNSDVEATEADEGMLGSSAELCKRIKRMITCVITNNRTFNPALGDVVNNFEFLKEDRKPQFPRIDCQIFIVCLSAFGKIEKDLETNYDRWLCAFKDAAQSTPTSLPDYKRIHSMGKVAGQGANQVPALVDFYSALRVANIPAEDLRVHNKIVSNYNCAVAAVARDAMRAEKLRIVRAMHAKKFGTEVIAEATALSPDAVVAVLGAKTDDAALSLILSELIATGVLARY